MYKSQDKVYIKELKSKILNSGCPDVNNIWENCWRQICLDDLNSYFRSSVKEPIDYHRGNLLSETVVVFDSLSLNLMAVDFLKTLMKTMNLDYNDIYATSYVKSKDITEAQSIDFFTREMAVLKPKQIIIFSNSTLLHATASALVYDGVNVEVSVIDVDLLSEMISLRNLDPSMITQDQMDRLINVRQTLWANLRNLLNYHQSRS